MEGEVARLQIVLESKLELTDQIVDSNKMLTQKKALQLFLNNIAEFSEESLRSRVDQKKLVLNMYIFALTLFKNLRKKNVVLLWGTSALLRNKAIFGDDKNQMECYQSQIYPLNSSADFEQYTPSD